MSIKKKGYSQDASLFFISAYVERHSKNGSLKIPFQVKKLKMYRIVLLCALQFISNLIHVDRSTFITPSTVCYFNYKRFVNAKGVKHATFVQQTHHHSYGIALSEMQVSIN